MQCDDRDHLAAKRVDCAGTQFGLLFRQVFRTVQVALDTALPRRRGAQATHTNVGNLVAGKKLTQPFRYALATGNWGIMSTKGNTAQNGVAQQLGRMTSASTIVPAVASSPHPVARETKNPKPRQLHHTCWGLICGMDTPEGIRVRPDQVARDAGARTGRRPAPCGTARPVAPPDARRAVRGVGGTRGGAAEACPCSSTAAVRLRDATGQPSRWWRTCATCGAPRAPV